MLTRPALQDYIWRRTARVLPLYFVVLAFTVVLLFGFGVSPYLQTGPADVIQAATLVYGTGVLWSIPVEVQFYVLFLALWFAAARGRLAVAIAALIILQAFTVVGVYSISGLGEKLANTYTLAFWLHFFLFGTALGYLSTSQRFMQARDWRSPVIIPVTGLILLAGVITPPGIREALGIPRTHVFADPIGAGYPLLLLVLGVLNLGAVRVFSGPLWRWLGKVSFSLYLLHMPVIATLTAMPLPIWSKAALVFVITLAVSVLSERWIERRAQNYLFKVRNKLNAQDKIISNAAL